MTGGPRFRYSRWDGTQSVPDLGAADVLEELTDDLLYHGDLNAALRRMLQSGLRQPDGTQLQGLREMLDRLRQRRRQLLDRHDLGGVYDEVVAELAAVVDEERAALDEAARRAAGAGDRAAGDDVERRRLALDVVGPDLASTVRDLQSYDFTSPSAGRRFDELVERLQRQLAQGLVDRMAAAMADPDPAQLARTKDVLAELNRMVDQRRRGEPHDFDGFMERHGDLFPEGPRDLDELLEVLARRMAAMEALLGSLTPDQRDQLRALSEQLLDDLDLRWQVDQLAEHLRAAFPDLGWERRHEFRGRDPLSLAQAGEVLEELGDIDQLENLLRGASSPGALAEVDLDRARQLLGEEAAESLGRLAEIGRALEEAGLVEQRDGRYELTPRGVRRLGSNALADLFRQLQGTTAGTHAVPRPGTGHERDVDTKPYELGDPFNLHIERTVRNAVRRTGGGTPVRLTAEDFEVERTEQLVRSATVVMLDLSLSMPMRDNFLPAKKVAMALHALISSQYPRDYLGIVGFSEVARPIEPARLPEVAWDFVYGTNMAHGLQLSRRLLARQTGTRQILMITDGEPTAHVQPDGEVFFSYPPARATVDATLAEVARCTREGVRINTFMLDPSPHLCEFVEKLTALNRGRAFFTTPDDLGGYVLVDFLEQRRQARRAG